MLGAALYDILDIGKNMRKDQQKPLTKPAENLFTIPADQDFVRAIAQNILSKTKGDPLSLADYTIILPSSDACRNLKATLQELSEDKILILPEIKTPKDISSEDAGLKFPNDLKLAKEILNLPPAISPLQRKILLSKEILNIPELAAAPQNAIRLASELGRFLDQLHDENIEVSKLQKFLEETPGENLENAKKLFTLLSDTWPKTLKKAGKTEPVIHKNTILNAQAKYWEKNPTEKPVIIAGFSHPSLSIVSLIKSIADLPNGSVVFPDLNTEIDPESWTHLEESHPQYGIKKTLEALEQGLNVVTRWPTTAFQKNARSPNLKNTSKSRRRLLEEALRPAETSEKWSKLKKVAQKKTTARKRAAPKKSRRTEVSNDIDVRALTGMDLVNCGTPQEEASVIALKVREALEVSDRSVALVTPDKALARRVSARLLYWGITVQDTSAYSLDNTYVGSWLRLTAGMAAEDLSPIPLLECLKHPLAAGGEDKKDFHEKIIGLEKMALRGPRPQSGHKGLEKSLTNAFNKAAKRTKSSKVQKQLKETQQELGNWLKHIQKISSPFMNAMNSEDKPFAELLDLHIQFAEDLASTNTESGTQRLWTRKDGKMALRFLTQLREIASELPNITGREYMSMMEELMKETPVQLNRTSHPDVKILTPQEARLSKTDIIIIGGLNEGVWPPTPAEAPWLSREMAKELGMTSSDITIGKSAHDFVQCAANPNVLMTRSERKGQSPAVSSPFLTRLQMVLKGIGLEDELESKTQLKAINQALHTPTKVNPINPPAPTPPVSKRPKKLSVSGIEALLRDPYSVYARHILKLYPMPSIDSDPSFSERGIFIHEALENFVKKYPDKMPKDSYEKLLEFGKEAFHDRLENPSIQAFWWPRFERIAKWFIDQETERRDYAKTLGTEVEGKLEIETEAGSFTLTAIADRLDRMDDDLIAIIDYKTGGVPSQKAVAKGMSPQLTLEALIALAGGFKGIEASEVGSLEYWKLSGSRPAGKKTLVQEDIQKLEEDALDGLKRLVEAFADKDTPYLPAPRPGLAPKFNDYLHLSRVDEWGHNAGHKKSGKKTPKYAQSRGGRKTSAKRTGRKK